MTYFSLDIRTIFITQVVINLTMGLALLVATRGRYQYGVNYFIGFFFLQTISQLAYIFRGIWPDFVTIVLANTLLIITYNLGYMGYCRFFNRDPDIWIIVIPILIVFIVFWVYVNDFRVRVITLGLVSSAQYLVQFWLLLTTSGYGVKQSKPILLSAYGMTIVLFTLRAVYMMIYPDSIRDMFDTSWVNSATLFATILSVILIASGVLLMLSERLLEENRELATRDWLTHIFNRKTFSDLSIRELARASRNNHETSLLMLDIDHFKVVNDSYGHPVGDKALVHLVKIIKDSVRVQDLYGRWGGEEFVILLAETGADEAFSIAERLRQRIADSTLVVQNHIIKLTVSIGISTFAGCDKPDLDCMIEEADKAMYEAKHSGRNCIKIANTLERIEPVMRVVT